MNFPVIVPVSPKDLTTWPWCAEGIRQCLRPSELIVIASASIRQQTSVWADRFIDEDSVVPGLRAKSYEESRWSWYFQQILKLGISRHLNTAHYVVVDSDLVFLNPVELFNKQGAPLYSRGTDYNPLYFHTFYALFGFQAARECSFISHHMVFTTRIVQEMLSQMKGRLPWWQNLVELRHPDPRTGLAARFSEYETYGHYLKQHYPALCNMRDLRIGTEARMPSATLLRRLSAAFDAVGFHQHSRTPLQVWRITLHNDFISTLARLGRLPDRWQPRDQIANPTWH